MIDVIVIAVPIVMHTPGERAMPFSIFVQSSSQIVPAQRSAQNLIMSLPLASTFPFQLPRSIGPAGRKMLGRFTLIAPISRPGPVLSQPPISTAPSIG